MGHEAEPVLKNAGLASLGDIIAAVKARASRMEEIESSTLPLPPSINGSWISAIGLAFLASGNGNSPLRRSSGRKDRSALRTAALKLGINEPASIEGNLTRLRAQRPTLNEQERRLEGEQRAANALCDEKQKELLEAGEKLLAAKSEVEGYTDGLISHLLAEQSQLAAKLKATNRNCKR